MEVTDGIFIARRFNAGDADMIEFRRIADDTVVNMVRANAQWRREDGRRLTFADRIASWGPVATPRAPAPDPFDHDGDGKPGGSKPRKRTPRKPQK